MRSIKGKTILVTGGAGFIGSHLVDNLLKKDAKEIIVIDNLFLGKTENLQEAHCDKRLSFHNDDIENYHCLETIARENHIDIVFNCATKALNYSFINPHNAFNTNTNGVLNLLELQRKGLFKSLCHFSTSEVYGSAKYEPMDELHPKTPLTTYAAGKASADLAIESYVNMFELDSIIVRPFNNYGPRQNHQGLLAAVIPITIYRILNGLEPQILGDGLQSRDFIYVQDTVDAVISLFEVLNPGEAVNIAANNQISIVSLIEMIAEKLNYKGQVKKLSKRESDVDCHLACTHKLSKLIDFNPTEMDIGLNKTIEWYRDLLTSNKS